jgi:cell shape-determining protein MreC
MNHTVFLAQLSKRETPTPPDSIHPRREWVELAELREKLATAEAQNKRLAEALELIARYSLDESPQQTRIIAKNALAELEKQQ